MLNKLNNLNCFLVCLLVCSGREGGLTDAPTTEANPEITDTQEAKAFRYYSRATGIDNWLNEGVAMITQ